MGRRESGERGRSGGVEREEKEKVVEEGWGGDGWEGVGGRVGRGFGDARKGEMRDRRG